MIRNPYLQAGFQPRAVFGAAGNFTPAPGNYFGRGWGNRPGWGGNYSQFQGRGGCSPCAPNPNNEGARHRLAEVLNMLKYPQGQWPMMPPLSDCSEQGVAERVVAAAQEHADQLKTIYGVDSGATLIPNGTTATITVTPQKRHIPEKLVLSTAMAGTFLITGIFAGVEPVLATTGPISASIFEPDSTSPAFKSIVMDVGMDFSVSVTNISGADARFTATVVGKPVPLGL